MTEHQNTEYTFGETTKCFLAFQISTQSQKNYPDHGSHSPLAFLQFIWGSGIVYLRFSQTCELLDKQDFSPCSYFPTLPQAFSVQLRPRHAHHGDFTLKRPMFSVQTMPEKFSENGGLTQKTHHMFSLIYMLHYTRKKEFVNATITWFCV